MKLRKWVQYVIAFIMIIAFCTLGYENDDTLVFITSHLTSMLVLIGGAIILEKYGTITK